MKAELVAGAAIALLFACVALRESHAPDATVLAAPGGLVQSGMGLKLPAAHWRTGGAADSRLSDEIASWNGKAKKAVPVQASGLKGKIKSEVNALRLSDFLSGVSPKETEAQIKKIYAKDDPKDTLGWKGMIQWPKKPANKKVQVEQLNVYKKELQRELMHSRSTDSQHTQKVRSELSELLKRRHQLEDEIVDSEHGLGRHAARRMWTRPARNVGGASRVMDRLARPGDNKVTYASWLRSTLNGVHEAHHLTAKTKAKLDAAIRNGAPLPRVTAIGELQWDGAKHARGRSHQAAHHARLKAKARLQALSEGSDEGESVDNDDDAEIDDDVFGDDAVQAKKRESLQERADAKVYKWMGGGYVDIYGR